MNFDITRTSSWSLFTVKEVQVAKNMLLIVDLAQMLSCIHQWYASSCAIVVTIFSKMLIINKVKVALLTVSYTAEYQHFVFQKAFLLFLSSLTCWPYTGRTFQTWVMVETHNFLLGWLSVNTSPYYYGSRRTHCCYSADLVSICYNTPMICVIPEAIGTPQWAVQMSSSCCYWTLPSA